MQVCYIKAAVLDKIKNIQELSYIQIIFSSINSESDTTFQTNLQLAIEMMKYFKMLHMDLKVFDL